MERWKERLCERMFVFQYRCKMAASLDACSSDVEIRTGRGRFFLQPSK